MVDQTDFEEEGEKNYVTGEMVGIWEWRAK